MPTWKMPLILRGLHIFGGKLFVPPVRGLNTARDARVIILIYSLGCTRVSRFPLGKYDFPFPTGSGWRASKTRQFPVFKLETSEADASVRLNIQPLNIKRSLLV